jgi:type I restriction enzyme S subunit
MRRDHAKLPLGDLCEFINGNGFRPPDWSADGLPIIRIQNLNGSDDFHYFAGKPKDSWLVHTGDILFAWAGVRGVSFGPTIWSGSTGVLNQHIFRVVPRETVDAYWLFVALKLVTAKIEARAHGFKSSLLHVKRGEIVDQIIDVPPLAEQRVITQMLRSWDDAIEKSERLLSLNRLLLRAMEDRLVGAEVSLKNNWPTRMLSQIANRVRRRGDGAEHPVMTISGKSGFLRQDEKYSRFMAGDSLENYTLLRRGEFAYNKGNSKSYPQGCIYKLEQNSALVPHVYISFSLREELDENFYAHLFRTGFLNRQLAKIVNSGVRNNGLLNVGIEEFFSCKVPVPPLDEQRRIARLFDSAGAEIGAREIKVKLLNQQKRGLMQKLLTGEWRVPIRDSDVDAMAARLTEEAAQ